MTEKTKLYVVCMVLLLVFFLPRIALLFNGLDSQRLWDTNTGAAFQLLYSARAGTTGSFYATIQKYPLLGSYLFLPTIALYVGAGRVLGAFHSVSEFVYVYALGETRVFFWIRLEMLVINIAALLLLFHVTARFTGGNRRAGLFALLFAAVNFYVTLFSVQPRIHSFAFASTIVVMYTSFLLLEKKTLRRSLFAFGMAAIAGSVSQSGLTTLIYPILAHTLHDGKLRWQQPRSFLAGLGVFFFGVLMLGYPQALVLAFRNGLAGIYQVFLSTEHSQPLFGLGYVAKWIREYFLSADLASTWMLCLLFWFFVCVRRKYRLRFDAYDALAWAHVGLFLLVFGFSNVMTGRFLLGALPSFFFIFARACVRLEKRKGVVYAVAFFLAVQAYGVTQLSLIAFGGDTRNRAAKFLLAHTNENSRIIGTLDPVMLGVTPAPHSVLRGDVGSAGAIDTLIAERNLVGEKSRQYTYWHPNDGRVREEELSSFQYLLISSDHPDRHIGEDQALRNGFRIVETFSPRHDADTKNRSMIAWSPVMPVSILPLPLQLRAFTSFGPTIVVYEKKL